jgi:hypothetical protein
MTDFLPLIITAGIIGGLLFFRGGYVIYSNVNDPDQNYQIGSKHMDNSLLTGFFGKSGGGKKSRHRKHKKGKNTRKK